MSASRIPQGVSAKEAVREAFMGLRRGLPDLPDEDLPDFMGDLARLEAETQLRLSLPRQEPALAGCDRLINVREAAGRLAMSVSQLYKTADGFSFTMRRGRALRFSSLGIDRWISKRAR